MRFFWLLFALLCASVIHTLCPLVLLTNLVRYVVLISPNGEGFGAYRV